jgi:hypothetical protein
MTCSQNDLGLKPADAALASGKRSTGELLLTYETSLALTKDLLTGERTQDALASDNSEIRTQFRYMSEHSPGTPLNQDTVKAHHTITTGYSSGTHLN